MLRRAILILILAAIMAVLVALGAGVASAVDHTTVQCTSGKVCKGTDGPDWIFGSPGNDNIRPMGGNDYVFANGGDDQVAHSSGDDRIFGGCGSDTVRGGFGSDIIYANMPDSWVNMLNLQGRCAFVTTSLGSAQITALAGAAGLQYPDVDDGYYDLVDCAYLSTRGNTGDDVGLGQPINPNDAAVDDTVVDCSNRDDQAP